MDFLNYLTDAYLIFLLPRYDTSLKVQARNPRKVYAIDQGLVNFSSVSGSPDRGRLLENTVYLQLRRLGYEIWYFKGKKECDFIFRDGKNAFSAIQVSWQVGDQNEKREVEGLIEAIIQLNLTEGTIITFDQEDILVKDGKNNPVGPGLEVDGIKYHPVNVWGKERELPEVPKESFKRAAATRRGGLRAISCQADKLPERKDTHRKPLLPPLRVADVMGWFSINIGFF